MNVEDASILSSKSSGSSLNPDKDRDDSLTEHGTLSPTDDAYDDASFLPKFHNTLFKRPHDENDSENNKTALDNGMSSLRCDVSKLPPLPNPRSDARRQETNVGIMLVLTLSLICIGITHGVSLTFVGGIERDSATWWTFIILVYSETTIAMLCLTGLLLTDPGVVSRSPENSFPIPMQCETWIQAHIDGSPETVEPPTEFYIASSDPTTPGDTYCVRCLVWRRFRYSSLYFHCSVCQRCTMHFDHHCSVFGRCIAGTWWKGNYKFFVAIIVVGNAGYLTAIVSLIWSLSLRYKPQIAIPVCIVCLWLTMGIFMGKLCHGVCRSCRTFALCCTDVVRKTLGI